MKNTKLILLSLIIGISLAACTDEKTMISSNPVAPVLSVPTHTSQMYNSTTGAYELVKDSADNTITTFAATAADYGVDTEVTYSLEICASGNNFVDFYEITSSTSPIIPITVSQLNGPIASEGMLNGSTDAASSYDVRIKSSIGATKEVLYSNVQTIKVKAYPTYGLLYVPGDYQSAYAGGNWTPSNPNTILYSSSNNGKYEGYLDMSNGGNASYFKFTEYPDWNHTNYGDDGAGKISGSGGNISLASGYYKLNVDIKALTYTATEITKFGVIGSFAASGWNTDVDMTFDSATKLWTATGVVFADGDKFKIRANGAWDLAFGIDSSGKYTTSGDNISIPSAGTYTIVLDLTQYGKPGYNITMTKE